jgi:hypothetical protein
LMSSNLYQSADNQAFTEANLLFQYVYKASPNMNYRRQYSYRRYRRSSWSSSPNRGFLTNLHFSGAMRYLIHAPKSYKPHLQLNTRFSLTEQFWLGGGWNTSNRFQVTFGYLRIPVFQYDVSRQEWQCWFTYDVPTQNAPRHGAELNLGYFF